MSSPRKSARFMRSSVAGFSALALVALGLVVADPAAAATAITVGTTVDSDANGACSNTAVTTPASPTSLRNALCVANNIGGATTITVPAGAYTLSSGALVVGRTPGTSIELRASGGRPVITGNGSTQLLTIDPDILGGVDVDIAGFEFRGGKDSVFGGGAIIAGSIDAPDPDTLVIDDTVFRNNAAAGGTANPGGAIQFIGGDLTITDSTFTGNSSGSASGGAVYYEAMAAGDALTVSGSEFTANTVGAGAIPAGGGAIAIDSNGVGSASITSSIFTGNAVTGAGARGGALDAVDGAVTAQYNSFVGNAGSASVRAAGTLTNNWWGCNAGPGTAGCDTADLSSGTASPYLVLTALPTATTIETSETIPLTVSLLVNSAGQTLPRVVLDGFDNTTVSWTGASPAGSTVTAATPFTLGESTAIFTAGTVGGAGGATATYGSASVPFTVGVRQNAAFTSPNTATATVGTPFLFAVTTTGFPVPDVSLTSGTAPAGLSVTPAPGGVSISGVPSAPGTYALTFTADNGGTPVQQTLTLTIGAAPAFTSPLAAEIAAGESVDETITTSGSPTPSITAQGALPAGLELSDNGDGTAHLHGTPTVAPGTYPIGLTASNAFGVTPGLFTLTVTSAPSFTSADHATFAAGAPGEFAVTIDPGFPALNAATLTGAPAWLSLTGAPGAQLLVGTPPAESGGMYTFTLAITGSAVSQTFTLTVNQAPSIILPPVSASVLEGTDATFTATASGHPIPTVQWQRFTGGTWVDIANATSTTLTIAATMADDGAQLRAVFTNALGTSTSNTVSLAVGQAPRLVAVDPIVADAGWPLTVNLTTTGLPHGAITASGVPSWLTFTDNGDGTARLAGLPSIANVGAYTVTLAVDNGLGTDSIIVQITVIGAVPAFTSTLSATIAEGEALDEVVTSAGIPTPALSAATLPSGLSFTDEGDGTGRLTGTPALPPGVHTFDLTAANAHGSVTRTFTLTITAPPAFTSADHTSFTSGVAGSFAVTVDPGYPQLAAVSITGAPAWLSLAGGILVGTPPPGSGGTYSFDLSIDGSAVVQSFTLTVNEAPIVTGHPGSQTLLEGADAVFTAAASGYPAPAVQWQRFVGGSWTDIAGATATTLSFTATIADDGARVRAVFTSTSGTATSDEAVLTVGQVPAFVEVDPVAALAGGALAVDIESTGLPAGVITASGLPAWLSFIDHGDGAATLSGTPTLADAGEATVVLEVDNGFGADEMTVQVSVKAEVPLPLVIDVADGALTGVPPTVMRSQRITVGGTGYLPGSVIQLGIYSAPTSLGTVVADATGAFSVAVTIPADQSLGAHTVAASGISASGTARLLTAGTTVVLPPSTGAASSSGALPATGADGSQSLGLMLAALLAILAGLALARRAHRRSA